MPTLEKKMFAGKEDLDPGECAKLEIKNLTSDIQAYFAEYNGTGEAARCVGLTLSPDNKNIVRGNFLTVGKLGEHKEEAGRM
jgi:hypothetical protein